MVGRRNISLPSPLCSARSARAAVGLAAVRPTCLRQRLTSQPNFSCSLFSPRPSIPLSLSLQRQRRIEPQEEDKTPTDQSKSRVMGTDPAAASSSSAPEDGLRGGRAAAGGSSAWGSPDPPPAPAAASSSSAAPAGDGVMDVMGPPTSSAAAAAPPSAAANGGGGTAKMAWGRVHSKSHATTRSGTSTATNGGEDEGSSSSGSSSSSAQAPPPPPPPAIVPTASPDTIARAVHLARVSSVSCGPCSEISSCGKSMCIRGSVRGDIGTKKKKSSHNTATHLYLCRFWL